MIAAKIIGASCAASWAICAFISIEPNPFAWGMGGRVACFVMAAVIGLGLATNEALK